MSAQGDGASDAYLDSMYAAKNGAEIPAFILQDVPRYRMQIQRAMRDGDDETVRKLVGEIDGFVDTHYGELRPWTQISEQGSWGETAARDALSVLDGSYKDMWTVGSGSGGARSVSMFLDDTDPATVARRADRLSREYGIDSSTAQALIDPNSDMYPVFRQYGNALLAQASNAKGAEALMRARPAVVSSLRSAETFVKEYGSSFASVGELGDFVTQYDQLFNANGMSSGPVLMNSIARGFLGERSRGSQVDVAGYLNGVRDLSSSIVAALTPPQGKDAAKAPPFDRSRVHEANSIMAAYIDEVGKFGGSVTPGGLTAAGLAAAANRVAMASHVYGIDLRDGTAGTSRLVARMALKQAGVEGADDGGVSEFLEGLAGATDAVIGADAQTKDSFRELESTLRKELGRTLWSIRNETGSKSFGTRSVQEVLNYAVSQAPDRLHGALAGVLAPRLADSGLAGKVAQGLLDAYVEGRDTTVAEQLRNLTGMFDQATGAPVISSAVQLSATADIDQTDLSKIAAAPGEVFPTLGALDREAAQKFAEARAAKDTVAESERALDLVEASAGLQFPSHLSSWFTKMLYKGDSARDIPPEGYKDLATSVRNGSPDALILAAMLYDRGGLSLSSGSLPNLAPKIVHDLNLILGVPGLRGAVLDLRGALKSSVPIPEGASAVSAVLTKLAAQGDMDRSALVKSEFLDPRDGSVSIKRVLVNLQDRGYSNPGTSKAPEVTEEQRIARRAYSSFMDRSTAVGSAMERYTAHLKSQGYDDKSVTVAQGRMGARFAEAYKHGGAVAVEQLAHKALQRRVRFVPLQDPQSGQWLYDVVRPLPRQLTDDEYDEYLANLVDTTRLVEVKGPDGKKTVLSTNFDETRFRDIDATGPESYRRRLEMENHARQKAMDAKAKQSVEQSPI
jgi:hypothetical protein